MSAPTGKDKFLYAIAKTACQAQSGVSELRFMVEALTKTLDDFPEVAVVFYGHYQEIVAGEEAQGLRADAQQLEETLEQFRQELDLE